MTTPLGHFQSTTRVFSFSGDLPEELEYDLYTVRIAAQANGCKGWTPIRGWTRDGGYITSRDKELGFDFVIMRNNLYLADTDGLKEMSSPGAGNGETQAVWYDLSGRKVSVQPLMPAGLGKGVYIINGKKAVR